MPESTKILGGFFKEEGIANAKELRLSPTQLDKYHVKLGKAKEIKKAAEEEARCARESAARVAKEGAMRVRTGEMGTEAL